MGAATEKMSRIWETDQQRREREAMEAARGPLPLRGHYLRYVEGWPDAPPKPKPTTNLKPTPKVPRNGPSAGMSPSDPMRQVPFIYEYDMTPVCYD